MPKPFMSFIAVVFAFASCEIFSQETLEGYHNDLDTLRSWVDEIHPWPYSRCSIEDADSAFRKAHSEIDSSTTIIEFSKLIGRTLGVFSDSHTLISLEQFQSSIAKSKGEFKLRLRYIEEKFYVMTDPYDMIELGTEIVKINGNPIIEYFNSALNFSPTEGNSYTSKVRIASILINDFVLYDLYDGKSEIQIETSEGILIDYPIVKRDLKKEKVKSVVEWVWPIEGDSIVTLRVKSFIQGKDSRYLKELKKGFKKLNNSDYDHLVIDLRGNLGGSALRMEYLFNYITNEEFSFPEYIIYKQSKETKKNYNDIYSGFTKWVIDKVGNKDQYRELLRRSTQLEIGETDTIIFKPTNYSLNHVFEENTCLLIDGLSASASVSFAAFYKKFNRGEIIGETCMGSMTGTFGNPIKRTLKNSRIEVSIASVAFALDSTLKWHSTPIYPNRFIQVSPDEMRTGIDPYDYAINDWYSFPNVSKNFSFYNRDSQIMFSELETVYSLNRSWSGELRRDVFDLIVECDSCIFEYNKLIKEVEKSLVSEEEILESVTELYASKNECVEMRNAKINLKLPLELRTTFNELIAPNRPAVLHFGIHNRAYCNVCK